MISKDQERRMIIGTTLTDNPKMPYSKERIVVSTGL